jgi:adenine-specific DNA-methyltransferase
MKKQRLELTWIGKDERPRLEPRILLEDAENSYHAAIASESNNLDNRLIFGDNLLALKALEEEFIGRVKCVYIDPPFNTKQAFDHYEDGLEHSLWLTLMRDRLEIIHKLLCTDGSLFVHIDDNEIAYLVGILDEIFGRNNRISIITFKQGAATGHKAINPGVVSTSNFILTYEKDKKYWKPNRVFTGRLERDKRYSQFITNINDDFDKWSFMTLSSAFAISLCLPERGLKKQLGGDYEAKLTNFVHVNAKSVVRFARPDYEAVSSAARTMIDKSSAHPEQIMRLERVDVSDMYFIGGERILFYADKLKLIDGEYVASEPLTSIWDDILSNNLHNEGGVDFPKGKKPEALIKRCLDLVTARGDLVLDSFAGSGTTGAVAQKMGRRWIMIELGAHCHTHIIPRLKQVIDGSDLSGVTAATSWRGGGGFRYFHLAPSLLEKDRFGNWVIAKEYNAAMLAESVCKLMGFTYDPSQNAEEYWQHGHSTESDFIYITTQSLTHDALKKLADEVGPDRTLLVCCKAFNAREAAFPNLTVKKIPQTVLSKCEWGRDNYSLSVSSGPVAEAIESLPADAENETANSVMKPRGRARKVASTEPSLFSDVEGK